MYAFKLLHDSAYMHQFTYTSPSMSTVAALSITNVWRNRNAGVSGGTMPMLSRWGHKDCGSLHILGLLASAYRKEHLATSQHITSHVMSQGLC